MSYTITGVVPQPMYDPKRPVFQHDPSTMPPQTGKRSKPYPVGEAGRTVTVQTGTQARMRTFKAIFEALFEDVTVTKDG